MTRSPARIFILSILMLVVGQVQATPIVVEALTHSSNAGSGAGKDTGLDLAVGDRLVISVDFDDLWSAGPNDRTSNANGLGVDNYTCPTCGTYPLYNNSGLETEFGSLVGRIDGGGFFKIGAWFNQIVSDTGRLSLFYWD